MRCNIGDKITTGDTVKKYYGLQDYFLVVGEIHCTTYYMYLVLTPNASNMGATFLIDQQTCTQYNIDSKYIGHRAGTLHEKSISSILVCSQAPKNGGEVCKKCRDFYPYAVPNQVDGTLICWSCRL